MLFPITRIGSTDMRELIQPKQDGYRVTKSDLYSDNSKRTAETGELLLYPIRKDIYSIEVEYSGTSEEIAAVESAVTGANRYSVTFLDSGSYVTKSMYPSDRSKSTSFIDSDGQHETLSFTLIEI